MKRKNIITGIIVCIVLVLIGVSLYIYKSFVNNIRAGTSQNIVQQAVIPIKKIKGLDLEKSEINKDTLTDFISYFDNLKEKLGDDKSFDENKNKYMQGLKDYLDYDYFINMANNKKENVFADVLKEIHSNENMHLYNVTLVGIGKEIENDTEVYKFIVDVNAMDDNIGFHVQRLTLYIDNDKRILKAEKDGLLHDQANTTSPLNDKSIMDGNTNKEFEGELNFLIKNMKNKNLYNKIETETLKPDTPEWKSFASKLNIKEPDYISLYNMFKQGKGEFSSWGIVSFMNTDIDVNPITKYTINIADETGVSSYDITFNRSNNKIIKISNVE